jgi:hypothetical protein
MTTDDDRRAAVTTDGEFPLFLPASGTGLDTVSSTRAGGAKSCRRRFGDGRCRDASGALEALGVRATVALRLALVFFPTICVSPIAGLPPPRPCRLCSAVTDHQSPTALWASGGERPDLCHWPFPSGATTRLALVAYICS